MQVPYFNLQQLLALWLVLHIRSFVWLLVYLQDKQLNAETKMTMLLTDNKPTFLRLHWVMVPLAQHEIAISSAHLKCSNFSFVNLRSNNDITWVKLRTFHRVKSSLPFLRSVPFIAYLSSSSSFVKVPLCKSHHVKNNTFPIYHLCGFCLWKIFLCNTLFKLFFLFC